MFKSIFQRLLVTYLLLTLIIITGLTLIVSAGYSNYFLSEKEEELKQVADKAKELSTSFYAGDIDLNTLNTSIDALGSSTDSLIYILKLNKKEIPSDGNMTIAGLEDKAITKDIFRVLSGQEIIKKKQYSEAFAMDVLLIGLPLSLDQQTSGAIILMHPLDNIKAALHKMNIYIWIAALATFLLSIPLVYFNSLKISNPITKIDLDVRKLKEGQTFDAVLFDSQDEIGRLSKSFNDMKLELEKTERMRKEMISNISHELRTPLTSINGFVQGILDGIVTEEKQKDCLEIIKEESSRLIGLTSEIIDLAKLQSGNVKLNIVDLNLNAEVDKTVSSLSFADSDKQICISNLVDTDIFVFADKDRLKQILINLLSNSIKYSKDSINIEITAEKHDRSVKISVKDNGPGVNELDLPFLFDKFYRSDSRSYNVGGAGIGLSVVKELVSLLGGTTEAVPNPSGGLIICFTLPLSYKQ